MKSVIWDECQGRSAATELLNCICPSLQNPDFEWLYYLRRALSENWSSCRPTLIFTSFTSTKVFLEDSALTT
ncbi:MAG: hypothetical protein MPW15_13515 [Candidatus Manganitrophus sp.]|nr:hypothetical protein [Candidatus Manganitrophus sp.]